MATVLIADDSAFMRSSLKFIVEKSGHEVVGAVEDGVRAVELYRELKPDLVTLDILMEGGDGLTALRAIMKDDPDARVIMVSALGQQEKQEEAWNSGATGYIRKPFKAEQVVEGIENALGSKGERRKGKAAVRKQRG